MNIKIDTKAKTIGIEENTKLKELITTLEAFFPSGEWKEYTLQGQPPYYIQPYIQPYKETTAPPLYPWQSPIIYGTSVTGSDIKFF